MKESANEFVGGCLPQPVLENVSQRFRLLSDPSRLRLINLLHVHGEMSVGELVEQSHLAYASVSKHLALLRAHGSLQRRREGTRIYYSIVDPWMGQLCQVVCNSLQEDWEGWGKMLDSTFEEPTGR